MARKPATRVKIPREIETLILVKSQRRCCICLGIENKDNAVIRGQIAHLDHDPSNNDPDNLAWMCMSHHDEYDGRTSQSKGFTLDEVKHHRDAMYSALQTGSGPRAGVSQYTPALSVAGNVNAGRDVVVGNVTQHITRVARGKRSAPPIIPGTVAEDVLKHNYLKYLVDRYNKFKSDDFPRASGRFSGAVIHKSYQREFKCAVCHTPLDQFERAAAYLQDRIRNTRVGRIEGKRGNVLFKTFEEFAISTLRRDPRLVRLYLEYHEPKVLLREFEPVFNRMLFLDDPQRLGDDELRSAVAELVALVKTIERDDFFAGRILELLQEPWSGEVICVPEPPEAERRHENYRKQHRARYNQQVIDAKDRVIALIMELLRYQPWRADRQNAHPD